MKDSQRMARVGFDKYFAVNSWEEANKSFFNKLAPKYDRLNEVISLGQIGRFRRSAIKSLRLNSGFRVLDVCTGSGDMAIDMHRVAPGIQVDGVDVAAEMLALAGDKVKRLNLSGINFYEANAMALPYNDNTFDAVMMGFGLRNLIDIPAGIKEMHRVLKPGGIFTTLDLGKPHGWQRGLYFIYFETLMPWLGKTIFHRNEFNSFAYLCTSNKYFPDSPTILAQMRNAGFRNSHARSFMFGGVAMQTGIK